MSVCLRLAHRARRCRPVAVAGPRRREKRDVLPWLAEAAVPGKEILGDLRWPRYVLAPGSGRLPELRVRKQRCERVSAEMRFEHEHGFFGRQKDIVPVEAPNLLWIKWRPILQERADGFSSFGLRGTTTTTRRCACAPSCSAASRSAISPTTLGLATAAIEIGSPARRSTMIERCPPIRSRVSRPTRTATTRSYGISFQLVRPSSRIARGSNSSFPLTG
jgi:hypothetical protein